MQVCDGSKLLSITLRAECCHVDVCCMMCRYHSLAELQLSGTMVCAISYIVIHSQILWNDALPWETFVACLLTLKPGLGRGMCLLAGVVAVDIDYLGTICSSCSLIAYCAAESPFL